MTLQHKQNDDWGVRWEERGNAIWKTLGKTRTPGTVDSFDWTDFTLPGACALTFENTDTSECLYITLGMTHPLEAGKDASKYEFSIRTRRHTDWPIDLLYQLVTQWLCEDGVMGFGYQISLLFFVDSSNKLMPSISDEIDYLNVQGDIRRLYLWPDEDRIVFKPQEGHFTLLSVVATTEDEGMLADETTPAHLMLLLKRMEVFRYCDPFRRSVLESSKSQIEWNKIRLLTHDQALDAFFVACDERHG